MPCSHYDLHTRLFWPVWPVVMAFGGELQVSSLDEITITTGKVVKDPRSRLFVSEIRVQSSAKLLSPGLVTFDPGLAYQFCLNLLAKFTQHGYGDFAEPFT